MYQEIFEKEKRKGSFKVENLLKFNYTQEQIDSIEEIRTIIENDKDLQYNQQISAMSRLDLHHENLKITKKLLKNKFNTKNQFHFDYFSMNSPAFQPVGVLHYKMFIPIIKYLGTDKQKEEWLPKCESLEMIGCYSQTELGHGSDVQNLQTTAVFDKNTSEFILNSPKIESMKVWPGDLGVNSTHAAVHARLYIDDVFYGIQTFIIQIRDSKTYETLKGVEAGDIGPKFAFNSKENGYMILTDLRVPRESMLAKYSKVDKNGVFKKRGDPKIGYAAMLEIRNYIVQFSPILMQQTLTIAIRYSIKRTQFQDDDNKEIQIIDYQTQLNKLVPLLAEAMVLHQGGQSINIMFHQTISDIEKNDFSKLKDLHQLMSACKSYHSNQMLNCIMNCQLACGGNGYLNSSRFNDIYRNYSTFATFEGENTILFLQTSRYLLKQLEKLRTQTPLTGFCKYIEQFNSLAQIQFPVKSEYSLDEYLTLLKYNSLAQLKFTSTKILKMIKKGGDIQEILNDKAQIHQVNCSISHIQYYLLDCFCTKLKEHEGSDIQSAMQNIGKVFALSIIISNPIKLLSSNILQVSQIKDLKLQYENLLLQLRPELCNIVDSFHMSDHLTGVLGRKQGDLYEDLLEEQKKSELNKQEVRQNIQSFYRETFRPKL